MANSDEMLQAYINKMLQLQNDYRDKPFTNEELKQVALDMGMSEEDWLESQKAFNGYLKSGQGHLNYRNWKDAVQELEQAAALNPNSHEAAYGLASAYSGLWLETQNDKYKVQAEKYAQWALQAKPGHPPTLAILSQLREGEKEAKKFKSFKTIMVAVGVGIALFIGILAYSGMYNAIVSKKETVTQKWAQVENVYQRRSDLIPQLIKTVKEASKFEKETLEKVVKARSLASSVQINPEKLTNKQLVEFQEKQEELSTALGRLLAISEQYPELKASQAFRELQVQIEGSENRISVERKRFNDAVAEYNKYIKSFPNNMMGFEELYKFKMKKGADKVPDIEF